MSVPLHSCAQPSVRAMCRMLARVPRLIVGLGLVCRALLVASAGPGGAQFGQFSGQTVNANFLQTRESDFNLIYDAQFYVHF